MPDKNKNIVITPINSKLKNQAEAFFIELLPIIDSDSQYSSEKEKTPAQHFISERITKHPGAAN
ncbi:MAG: hypothetical protein MZV64_69830 [Ignavibacteriales bacterium]|nr:hypothetical protein [Ignavibacteriales bacterium]